MPFGVVTARYASVHALNPNVQSMLSWWPGYSWSPAVCPVCGSHVGWMFLRDPHPQYDTLPEDHPYHHFYPRQFYALILEKLDMDASAVPSELV